MEYVELGTTGIRASVIGLGCGGPSRLGTRTHGDADRARAVVRRAIERGVTFFDTAESYGTEDLLGEVLAEARTGDASSRFVVSTKTAAHDRDGRPRSASEIIESVEGSLRRLRVDAIDVLHLHGVRPDEYDHADAIAGETFDRLRDAGSIRAGAISEAFIHDTRHVMLERAVAAPWCDVVMVGINLLNPSARRRILPATRTRGIGTLAMFAVRRALANRDDLRHAIDLLIEEGREPVEELRAIRADGLAFLGDRAAIIDAAYRFCRGTSGIDVTLVGTGDRDHLDANVDSILRPPLDEAILARLDALFGTVDSLSGHERAPSSDG